MKPTSEDDPADVERRRDEALRRALSTPPQPMSNQKGEKAVSKVNTRKTERTNEAK